MNWEDLRVFLAVARAGSLSGAARHLGVDQATISRRLAALEEELGVRLVDRLPRASRLTKVGSAILTEVVEIEEKSFSVVRKCQAFTTAAKAKLSITAPPILARHFIAPHINELSNSYPDLQLSILSEPQFVSLSKMEADVALRLSAPIDDTDIAKKIGRMKFALYAASDYAQRDTPNEWAFIGYHESQSDFAHKRWLYEVVGKRRVACEVADLSNQYEAACTGIGVAGLPRFLADPQSRLARLDDPQAPMLELDIWIAKHPDRRDDPVVRAVSLAIESLLQACGLGL